MKTTKVKTVKDLYETNSDIKGLIDYWVQHRRCPIGLVDELITEGLEDAADCALWAANQDERMIYNPHKGENSKPCPVYPSLIRFSDAIIGYWFWFASDDSLADASDVPKQNVPKDWLVYYGEQNENATPLQAIIWLLDNWKKIEEN